MGLYSMYAARLVKRADLNWQAARLIAHGRSVPLEDTEEKLPDLQTAIKNLADLDGRGTVARRIVRQYACSEIVLGHAVLGIQRWLAHLSDAQALLRGTVDLPQFRSNTVQLTLTFAVAALTTPLSPRERLEALDAMGGPGSQCVKKALVKALEATHITILLDRIDHALRVISQVILEGSLFQQGDITANSAAEIHGLVEELDLRLRTPSEPQLALVGEPELAAT